MNELLRDLRYATRGLRRSPGVSLVAIAALGIGIGATTAIFSLIQGILLDPLPYSDAGGIVAVLATEPERGAVRHPTSPANYLDWKERSRTIENMTAACVWSPDLTGRGRPEQLRGLRAAPELFRLLGTPALYGHTFDATSDDPRVVVLGHGLWQRRFGGDPGIVGATLVLENEPHTVVGVMPRGFHFPPFWAKDSEIWAPLAFDVGANPLSVSTNRGAHFLRVFGRLADGATLGEAQSEMQAIGAALAAEWPDDNEGLGIGVESLREPVVDGARPLLWILFGTVVAVLLIACGNVANLLLARGAARAREFSIRAALGAGRWRLVRQTLTESLLLAGLGGGVGLFVGWATLKGLQQLAPAGLPRLSEVSLDARVLAFTGALSLATGLLFGILPALRSAAGRPRLGTARGTAERHVGPGRVLVVLECALALVLLVGAGLLLNSLAQVLRVDPGFEPDDRIVFDLRYGADRYPDTLTQSLLVERIADDARNLPGVHSAGLIHILHIGGDTWGISFSAENGSGGPTTLGASPRVVTPGLFAALGVPIERGRDFDRRDRTESFPVIAVNRRLADMLWPDGDALGQRIKRGDAASDDPWLTIVAVVGDVHQDRLTDPARPEVYFPYTQTPFPWYHNATVVVHAAGPTAAVRSALDRSIAAIDPDIPVGDGRTLEQVLAVSVASARFNATLVAVFGGVALALAALGIYGVIAYSVSRRTAEIGVRMALGARPGAIYRMVLGQGLGPALVGLGVGLVAAFGLARFLGALLFEIDTSDPATLAVTSGLLLAVALLACLLPARRAAAIEPVIALRND